MDTISLEAASAVSKLLAELVAAGESFSYVAQSNFATDEHMAAVIETDDHSYIVFGSGRVEKERGTYSADRYEQIGE